MTKEKKVKEENIKNDALNSEESIEEEFARSSRR